jgi:hypothetical protein
MNIKSPFNKTKTADEALLPLGDKAVLIVKELPRFAKTVVLHIRN